MVATIPTPIPAVMSSFLSATVLAVTATDGELQAATATDADPQLQLATATDSQLQKATAADLDVFV